MERHLYISAGFPGKQWSPGSRHLNAGGLRQCIQNVEMLAELELSPHVQLRKGGTFIVTEVGSERLENFHVHISDMLEQKGITWDWFPENWGFGNGVTVHKTLASVEHRRVVHGTDLTFDQFLALNGPTRWADLSLELRHHRHKGWEKYEFRWLPGTCPQENHEEQLTWMVTTHEMAGRDYSRIKALVEEGAAPELRVL